MPLCFQLGNGILDLANGGIQLDSVDAEITDLNLIADVTEVDENWQVRITSQVRPCLATHVMSPFHPKEKILPNL